MNPRIKVYIRPLRRRWGLTQQEIAFLIGVKSGTVISRFEGEKRAPNLASAFAFALVFDVAPLELFPGLSSEVHEAVLRRANELYEELQGNPSKTTRFKLDFLEGVLARLDSGRNSTDV